MNDTATATARMLEGNLRAFAAHVSTADDVLDAPRMAELYAHAAACVRFVAALDRGEFAAHRREHFVNADERFALIFEGRDTPVCGPDALAAFRAAQDHLTGGPDDGQ